MARLKFPLSRPLSNGEARLVSSFADTAVSRTIELGELRLAPAIGAPPGVGASLADAYTIEKELGGGSMGVVFTAFDPALARRVAVKLIRSPLLSADFRARFMLEARAMARVSHPNVVTIHALGEHEGNPFMVMELVEGETLEFWMYRHGPQPDLDQALRILNDVCLGVIAIHAAGTLHRDLKPSNILLDQGERARVCDLGLAVPFRDGTVWKEVVGTPGFIAPEIQFNVSQHGGATPQSDLYSLACLAFELLTGEPPYSADDELTLAVLHATAPVPLASDSRRDLPPAFDQVLAQALAKDPKQRTQSVELFRRALSEARSDNLEPVRILVAEDDPDFRELVELVLTREFPGVEVECVADGRQAIAAFDRQPASVVVIDLRMPELDGMAVTALLRARPQAANVPIIVLSGMGGSKEWQMLSSLGADRFLVKPVILADLISTIRSVTRERSSGRSRPPSARPPV